MRDDLEEIADDAVIGDFEYGDFGVFVDGGDELGARHARKVLDGAGDDKGHVKVGRNGLTGLAALMPVAYPARIHGRAGRADGRMREQGRQFLEKAESLGPFIPLPPETTTSASVTSISAAASRILIRKSNSE